MIYYPIYALLIFTIVSCAESENTFPDACDCYQHWHSDNYVEQEMYEVTNPSKIPNFTQEDFDKCAQKFAPEKALKARGTEDFFLLMHISLKEKCNQ